MRLGPLTIELRGRTKAHTLERGATGASAYGGLVLQDYNTAMRGQLAVKTYEKMRRGDGTVSSVLWACKVPIVAAEWHVVPASNNPNDLIAKEFVEHCLFESLGRSFSSFMLEALSFLDFGYYMFEKVFKYEQWDYTNDDTGLSFGPKRMIKWKKFGPRHPKTVDEWVFDDTGTISGVKHIKILANAAQKQVTIPIQDLLLFTFMEEAGNPEGISILRSAYKHWYYKDNLYRIDAIQKERHGIGVPVIELPMGYGEADKTLANEMGKNLRTNESAHILKLPGWSIDFAKLEGQLVDVLKSAEHHDVQLAKSVLAQFLNLGMTGGGGSRALGESMQNLFLRSCRALAGFARDVLNAQAIPQLVKYNFDLDTLTGLPRLNIRRVGELQDFRALSVALRNLTEGQVIKPDERLEDFLRNLMDLPKRDPDTEREFKPGNNNAGIEKPVDF